MKFTKHDGYYTLEYEEDDKIKDFMGKPLYVYSGYTEPQKVDLKVSPKVEAIVDTILAYGDVVMNDMLHILFAEEILIDSESSVLDFESIHRIIFTFDKDSDPFDPSFKVSIEGT